MKTTQRLLTILLPVPLAVGIAALMAETAPGYRAYEIRMVTTMTSETLSPPNGGRTLMNIHFARDDGSRGARTVEAINGRPCTSTVYWDAKTHLKVTFDECAGMKSTEPFTVLPSFPSAARQTCRDSIRQRFEGVEILYGLRVEKYREGRRPGGLRRNLLCARVRLSEGPGCLRLEEPGWQDLGRHVRRTRRSEVGYMRSAVLPDPGWVSGGPAFGAPKRS